MRVKPLNKIIKHNALCVFQYFPVPHWIQSDPLGTNQNQLELLGWNCLDSDWIHSDLLGMMKYSNNFFI